MEGTIQNFQERFAKDPNDIEAFRALRDSYGQHERWTELAQLFENRATAMAAGLEAVHLHLIAAEVLELRVGNLELAIKNHEAALAIDKTNPTAINALVRIYEAHQRWKDFLRLAKKKLASLTRKAEKAEFHGRIGRIYDSKLDDPAKAALHFKKAFQSNPREVRFLAAGRQAYLRMDRWDMVVRLLDVELKLDIPASRTRELLWLKAAIQSEQLEQKDAARESYKVLLEKWESDPRMGEDREPAADWEQLKLTRPDSPLEQVIQTYEKSGEHRKLAAVLRREIKLRSNLEKKAELYLRLGHLSLEQLNDLEAAQADVERALTIVPFSPEALQMMETIYRRQEDWPGLDQILLKRVLQSEGEETVQLYHELLLNYKSRLDKPKQALDVLKRMMELAPEHQLVAQSIAYFKDSVQESRELLLALKTRLEKAELWSDVLKANLQLLEYTPDNEHLPLLRQSGEIAEIRLRDLGSAFEFYRQISDLFPDEESVYVKLEELAQQLDQPARLMALYERRLKQSPEDDPHRVILTQRMAALAAKNKDNPAAAFEAYYKLFKLNPSEVKLLETLEQFALEAGGQSIWTRLADVYAEAAEKSVLATVKSELLLKKYRIQLDHLNKREDAFSTLCGASLLVPKETALLADIERLSVEDKRFEDYIQYRRDRFGLLDNVAEQIQEAHQIAQFVERHNLDWELSFEFYLLAFQIDPFHAESEEKVLKICDTQKDWELYSKVIELKIREFDSLDEQTLLILKLGHLGLERLKDLSFARRQFERALRLNASNLQAFEGLKLVAESGNDWQKFVDFLDALVTQLADPDLTITYLIELAGILESRLSDVGKAARYYARVLEIDPYHRDAVDRLKIAYQMLGDKENLAALLLGQLGRPNTQSRVDQLVGAGTLKQELGQIEEAVNIFQQVLAMDPVNVTALDWLIGTYRRRSQFRELREVLEVRKTLLKGDDALPLVWELCFLYEALLDLPEKVWLTLKHLKDQFPEHPAVLMAIEAFLKRQDRWPELLTFYHDNEDLLSQRTRKTLIQLEMGLIYQRRLNDMTRALQCFQKALERDKSNSQILTGMIDCYAQLQQWSKAVATLDRLLDLTTHRVEQAALQELKGTILETKLFRFDQARKTYETLLALDPKHPIALTRLTHLLRKTGNWKKWVNYITHLNESGTSRQRQIENLWELAQVYQRELNDERRAQETLRAVLNLAPDHTEAQDMLLSMEIHDENWSDTLAVHLRKAQSSPARLKAQHYYEAALIADKQLADMDRAYEYYEAALSSDHKHFQSLVPLSRLSYDKRDWTRAEGFLYRFFGGMAKPENAKFVESIAADTLADLFSMLGAIYMSKNDFARALSAFQSSLDYHLTADLLLQVIDCALKQSEHQVAINNFKRLQQEFPGTADSGIKLRLANCYRATGQQEDARELLDQIKDDPEVMDEALSRLIEQSEKSEQYGSAAGYLEKLLFQTQDAEKRFKTLIRLNGLYQKAGNGEKAYDSLEKALAIREDVDLFLEMLALSEKLSRSTSIPTILKALEKHDPPPDTMADAFCTAGEIYQKNGIADKARKHFRTALMFDRGMARAFKGIERVYKAFDSPEPLIRFYEAFLSEAESDPPEQRREVYKKLIACKQKSRGAADPSLKDDFEAVLAADNTDRDVHRAFVRYVRETEGIESQCAKLIEYLSHFPGDAFGYQGLWSCAQEKNDTDLSFRVASLLFFTKEANAAQETLYLANRRSIKRPDKTIQPAQYERLIKIPSQHSWIYSILTLVNAESDDLFRIRPEERKLTSIRRVDDDSADRVGQMFVRLKGLLAAQPVTLYLGPGQDTNEILGNATPPYVILNEDFMLNLLEPQQTFLLGRLIELMRAEYILAMSFPGIELTSLIQALLSLARPKKSGGVLSSKLARSWRDALQTVLSKSTLSTLKKHVKKADASETAMDAADIAKSVHSEIVMTANRVGLVTMNDIVLAFKLLLRLEGEDISYIQSATAFGDLVSKYEPLRDILRYYLSDEYGELRRTLGLALDI